MSKKNKISELLHTMFSDKAIKSVALTEILEDTKYLVNNNIYDDNKKQQDMYNEAKNTCYKR